MSHEPIGSIAQSLFQANRDPIASRVLAQLKLSDVAILAREFACEDALGCATLARQSLAIILGYSPSSALIIQAIEHTLWCAWRTALWRTRLSLVGDSWDFRHLEYLEETIGKPTIVVTPMTISTFDVLSAVCKVARNREIVLYGEAVKRHSFETVGISENVAILDNGRSAPTHIVRALNRGALFCTYADFVYEGHPTVEGKLFSKTRPFSKAFIALCGRAEHNLLPVAIRRSGAEIQLEFSESVVIKTETADKEFRQRAALCLVEQFLESAIRYQPEQWLLLTTLAARTIRRLI